MPKVNKNVYIEVKIYPKGRGKKLKRVWLWWQNKGKKRSLFDGQQFDPTEV
ncbi:MAG: hypothetical protein KME01_00165 [Chroococcus sp. CMT-3BRIN-NPC107]|nr:hypothetical protein [Chroococcus sp. CMT-3BRIN-NPC107]